MGQELMSRMALVYAEIESIQCNNDDPYRHSKRSAKHAATRILEEAISNAMNVVQLANIIASDQRDEEKAKAKDTQ